MNKEDLIKEIAEEGELTKKVVNKVVTLAIAAIIKAVSNGEKLCLVGFGTFKNKTRKEKMGINPKTKERIKILQTTIPVFRAGKDFKRIVASKKISNE